ncbi:hypothetical protein [Ehrlichia japonica]|uniref:Uncharacterized protein n=1 Tax=Ehrlichia japonica TaxID=391036 RepID=X5H2X1_9RICK|nr:hypothetical protein [Ehrlichia japonica]AHX04435.1 hypothetical protein EHF_0962 [Ehrlichia japonica]
MISTKNTDTTQKTKTRTRKTNTTNKNKSESLDTNNITQAATLDSQVQKSESLDTNNITQAATLDSQVQNSDATLSNMDLINLKKVESDEAEIIYKPNTPQQSSFLKDLWHSLKEYFSSTQ